MTRPKRREITRTLREDLLYRLRWNILAAVNTIEIATGPYDQTVYVPLFEHSLANESLAQPPISCIAQLGIYEHYVDEELRIEPPPALTINNENGSPITIGQFVAEVHAYLNVNIDTLKQIKGELYGKQETREDGTSVTTVTYGQPYLPPDIAFFFSHVYAMTVDEAVKISVAVFAEGELGRATDKFWRTRLHVAHSRDQND